MPSYYESTAWTEPYKILGQGLQALANRRLQQKQLDIDQQRADVSKGELGVRQQELGLQRPMLEESGREARNKAAIDAAVGQAKPGVPFYQKSPEEQAAFHKVLADNHYSGDLSSAYNAHDAAAMGAIGFSGPALTQRAALGDDIQRPGVASTDGSPGVQPAAPPVNSGDGPAVPTNAGSPQLFLKSSVNRPTVGGATGQAGVPPSPTTNTQTPPQLNLRYKPQLYLKSGEKGNFPAFTGREDQASYDAPTPEQIDWLRGHPADIAKFPPVTQKLVAPIVENGVKNEEMLRKRMDEDGPISAYRGKGNVGGLRHIEHLMDAAVSRARDPRTGAIDWEKMNPVEAYSLIFSDAQANNPGAIVRQETAQGIEGLQGLGDKAWNFVQSQVHGNKLSPALKQNIYNMVKSKISGARDLAAQSFSNIDREAQDYGVPLHRIADQPFLDEYESAKRGGTLNKPQVSAPSFGAPGDLPTVTGKAQFDALPPGAKFISNGKTWTKPKK